MAYINITQPQDIIDCINSIDNTFKFSSFEELNSNLNAVGLLEDKERKHFDVFSQYFWFSGFINDTPVSVRIANPNYGDKSYILMEKYFYKELNGEIIKHRDNDLPAFIWHSHSDDGKVRLLQYYIEGELARKNKLLPTKVSFNDGCVGHHYKMPNYDVRPQDCITVDYIVLTNNKPTDICCYFGYSSSISLEKLISIVPRIEHFNSQELSNLKNMLTKEENLLLHMIYI
jgi:hypothetical protein